MMSETLVSVCHSMRMVSARFGYHRQAISGPRTPDQAVQLGVRQMGLANR